MEQAHEQHVDHAGMLGYLLVFGAATVAFYVFGTFKRTLTQTRN